MRGKRNGETRFTASPLSRRKARASVKSVPPALHEDAAPYRTAAADRLPQSSSTTEESQRRSAGTPFRFIDLFCGIGGFRIAFERAGCKCVFSCDWDEQAQITYEANFGDRPYGDIYSVPDNAIPSHHILCAGFPCQPFSIAGVSKKLSLGRKHGFEDKVWANTRSPIISGKLRRGGNEENLHPARPAFLATESVSPRTEQNSAPTLAVEKNSATACSKRHSTSRPV